MDRIKTGPWVDKFNEYLSGKGLRHSQPREVVAREFFRDDKHISVDELYKRVRKVNPHIGIATVYRTLNLLVEGGLALRREFATGAASYERNPETHHDHLLCTSCGKIVEFHREEIEDLQEHVAKSHGFTLSFHKMELYGLCKKCQRSSPKTSEMK